ncbi:MAG: undecaprenyl-diphosphate phosphatase [Candidatus Omnitrophica bacterium]|nr:undecaprenyl-diphosphate phosphatase [Candidatus Omnitrophota bacterium]
MDLFHALILGIVEGITEFLPVSSTGHLIITAKLLGLPQTEFLKTFDISIQLGAILSVVVLYWRSLLVDLDVIKRVAAAFIPTAVLGFGLYKIVKSVLLGNVYVVLWSLLLGGVVLIAFEMLHKEKADAVSDIKKMSLAQAALIGCFQAVAMIPGVSRSAATIIGGLFLGISRKTIVEFSFLLACPTMAAATGLDLLKSAHDFSADQFSFLAVGFISSFVVGILSIRFLLYFVRNHNFISFGVYRIIAAILLFKLL